MECRTIPYLLPEYREQGVMSRLYTTFNDMKNTYFSGGVNFAYTEKSNEKMQRLLNKEGLVDVTNGRDCTCLWETGAQKNHAIYMGSDLVEQLKIDI
jgi:hypothetical protein